MAFLNGRTDILGLRTHLNASTPIRVDLNALPDEQRELIDSALKRVSVGFAVEDLSKDDPPGNVEILLFRRAGGFIGNYAQVMVVQSEAGSLRAVASGQFGLINALVAAGAMSPEHGLTIAKEQTELTVKARRDFAGGMFSVDLHQVKDAQVRRQIIDGIKALKGREHQGGGDDFTSRNFFIERGKEEVYIGAYQGDPSVNLDQLGQIGQISPKINPLKLDYPEAPLGTPLMKPYKWEFQQVLTRLEFFEPAIPVVGGSGKIIRTPEEIKQEIVRELMLPRDKNQIRKALRGLGVSKPVEIGLKEVPRDNKNTSFLIALIITLGTVVYLGLIFRKHRQTN